jgi:hypothetical protein
MTLNIAFTSLIWSLNPSVPSLSLQSTSPQSFATFLYCSVYCHFIALDARSLHHIWSLDCHFIVLEYRPSLGLFLALHWALLFSRGRSETEEGDTHQSETEEGDTLHNRSLTPELVILSSGHLIVTVLFWSTGLHWALFFSRGLYPVLFSLASTYHLTQCSSD